VNVSTQTTDLFLLEDLADAARTSGLAERDLAALQSVAEWIEAFVVEPNAELGRDGPVCPFVPGSLERKTLWLAAEELGDGGVPEVVELMDGYRRRFLETEPTGGADASYRVIVVVFPDLAGERAETLFGGVLEQLALPSYAQDGISYGPFYEGNPGTALYNPSFRPFQSPVPFLFVRRTVVSDWKFFVDDDTWLDLWASHFGATGARALGAEVRRLPWRERPSSPD
jgi:uncharacterized protein DUF6875